MGATNSLDCKNAARSVKNFDRAQWEKAAGALCKEGIKAKFSQNQHLLEVLTKKTANKTLVECANDHLWANGIPLYSDTCLNRQRWISQGLLGKLLEEIRAELSDESTQSKGPSSVSANTTDNILMADNAVSDPTCHPYPVVPRMPVLSVSTPTTEDKESKPVKQNLTVDTTEANMELWWTSSEFHLSFTVITFTQRTYSPMTEV